MKSCVMYFFINMPKNEQKTRSFNNKIQIWTYVLIKIRSHVIDKHFVIYVMSLVFMKSLI